MQPLDVTHCVEGQSLAPLGRETKHFLKHTLVGRKFCVNGGADLWEKMCTRNLDPAIEKFGEISGVLVFTMEK